jgi:hypothetical protein
VPVANTRPSVQKQEHGVLFARAANPEIQRSAVERELLMLVDGKLLFHTRFLSLFRLREHDLIYSLHIISFYMILLLPDLWITNFYIVLEYF